MKIIPDYNYTQIYINFNISIELNFNLVYYQVK